MCNAVAEQLQARLGGRAVEVCNAHFLRQSPAFNSGSAFDVHRDTTDEEEDEEDIADLTVVVLLSTGCPAANASKRGRG